MTPMPTTPCPLFAAGFDWIEALLPFLFVAFWIISQVFAVFRRLQGGGRQPQPPVRIDRPRGQPRPPGGGADVRSELERQIQEFLRQATGEQARRPGGPPEPARPATPAQPRADQPSRGQPRTEPARKVEPARIERPSGQRPAAAPARKDPAGAATAKRVPGRQTVPPAPGSVAASLAPQGESVARHVQDAFSHDLTHERGGLAHDAPGAEPVMRRTNDLAAELAEMLRSPAATRRAILLREVLERPVDRW